MQWGEGGAVELDELAAVEVFAVVKRGVECSAISAHRRRGIEAWLRIARSQRRGLGEGADAGRGNPRDAAPLRDEGRVAQRLIAKVKIAGGIGGDGRVDLDAGVVEGLVGVVEGLAGGVVEEDELSRGGGDGLIRAVAPVDG